MIKHSGTQHRSSSILNKEQLMVTTIYCIATHDRRLAILIVTGDHIAKRNEDPLSFAQFSWFLSTGTLICDNAPNEICKGILVYLSPLTNSNWG